MPIVCELETEREALEAVKGSKNRSIAVAARLCHWTFGVSYRAARASKRTSSRSFYGFLATLTRCRVQAWGAYASGSVSAVS